MKRRSVGEVWVAVAAVMLLAWPAAGQSVREAIEKGNALLAAGKADEAIAAYEAGAAGSERPVELDFNRACALAASGKGAEAEALFRTVDRRAAGSDPKLAAGARFNLGALAYQRGKQAAAGGDASKALPDLRKSEELFRTARDLDRGDAESARNVELVRREIKQIEEAQKQQEQQQKQQQQKGEKQNKSQDQQQKQDEGGEQQQQQQQSGEGGQNSSGGKAGSGSGGGGGGEESTSEDARDPQTAREEAAKSLEDLARKQEAASKMSERLARDKQQAKSGDAAQQEDLKRREKEEAKRQDALNQQTKEAQERLKEQLKDKPEAMVKAREQQAEAAESLKQSKPEQAAKDQSEAADWLRKAAEAIRGEGKPQEQPPDQKAEAEGTIKPDKDGAAPPPKNRDLTIAQILEKERREREQLEKMRRRAAGRARLVDKDW